jgi:PPK2 family polyphosphate:nucleotide phosphotransferase
MSGRKRREIDRELVERYRVTDGSKFKLKDFDPGDTRPLARIDESRAAELLRGGIERLGDLQERLYAQDQRALLLIFQAMDAAGKDGTIKHVMSGVNPTGCRVTSFKVPSAAELDHDFLWRTAKELPERGIIGIFNRSYYEEVLVVRVHPEFLAKQRLPAECTGKKLWKHRFQSIVAHEEHLARNGTTVLKFFLYVSKKEQKKRFLERLEVPEKNWKFSAQDVAEREHWDEYMAAYEDMIRETASPHAPWFVVPADNKWFTRLAVSAAINDALDSMGLEFPPVDAARRAEIERCKQSLRDPKSKI